VKKQGTETRTKHGIERRKKVKKHPNLKPYTKTARRRRGSPSMRRTATLGRPGVPVCLGFSPGNRTGVEARGSSKHAGHVTLRNSHPAVHIGEAGGALMPGLGEDGIGDFTGELHGTRTETLCGTRILNSCGLQRNPDVCRVPERIGMARGAAAERTYEGTDEGDVR
jgi:hypothetical protein